MKRTVMICAGVFAGALWLNVQAQQARSVGDGVYSAAQATRGQEIYKNQCAECHGNALEGTVGSPLVGDSFLANWSARPLSALVDKIQKTMPFSTPGSLSRQQSTDLTAYMLQVGKFPAGRTELAEVTLTQIQFPAARRTSPVRRQRTEPSCDPHVSGRPILQHFVVRPGDPERQVRHRTVTDHDR